MVFLTNAFPISLVSLQAAMLLDLYSVTKTNANDVTLVKYTRNDGWCELSCDLRNITCRSTLGVGSIIVLQAEKHGPGY